MPICNIYYVKRIRELFFFHINFAFAFQSVAIIKCALHILTAAVQSAHYYATVMINTHN